MSENNNLIKSKTTHNLEGIQYLRGIAVFIVVLSHVTGMAKFPKYFDTSILGGFFKAGGTGVDLFFVISGFIIAYTSLSSNLKPKITVQKFLQKRAIRIIPLMWISIISYALLRYVGRDGFFDPLPILRALFLYPIGEVAPNVIWTLRHEALFYIIFCSSWFAGRFYLLIIGAWFVSPLLLMPFVDNTSTLFNFFFNKLNLLFGAGFVIAVLYLKGYIKPLFELRHVFIISIILGACLLIYSDITGYISNDPTQIRTTFDTALMAFVCATIVILMLIIRKTHESSWGNNLLLLLGEASYSIYLFHEFFISFSLGFWSKLNKNAYPPSVLFVVSSISIIGSVIIYFLIEKNVILKINKWVNRGK